MCFGINEALGFGGPDPALVSDANRAYGGHRETATNAPKLTRVNSYQYLLSVNEYEPT
jgi:hypothetical protein